MCRGHPDIADERKSRRHDRRGCAQRRDHDNGIARLAEKYRAHADDPVDRLPATLAEVLVDGEADDDIALVLLKVRGPEGRSLQVRLDTQGEAPAQARRAVRRQLESWAVPGEAVDELELITSELVTNAFVHARPPIDLRLRHSAHEIVLEVQDRAVLRPRRRRPDDDDEHGRGLNIIEVLATDWGTRASESGKTVWCTLRV